MEIKILGPGCRNCEKLQVNAVEALKKIGMEATIIKSAFPDCVTRVSVNLEINGFYPCYKY